MPASSSHGSTFTEVGLCSFGDVISNHLDDLRKILETAKGGATLEEFVDQVKREIETGDFAHLDGQFRDYLGTRGGSGGFYPLHLALTYLLLAQRAHSQGQRDEAWALQAAASYWVGRAHCETPQVESRATYCHLDISSKGGKERAAKFAPYYEAAAAKVMELAPAEGWKNIDAAISAVLDDVYDTLRSMQYDVKREDLANRLKRWNYKQDVFRSAIESNLRKNKSRMLSAVPEAVDHN